jgi:hypothetical protein
MRYEIHREGWRRCHRDTGVNRFSCSLHKPRDQYPPSIVGHYKAIKHCPYLTHTVWYVCVDNFSLYKNTNFTLPLTSKRPMALRHIKVSDPRQQCRRWNDTPTGWMSEEHWFDPGKEKTFICIFSKKTSSNLGPAKHPISWVTGTVSPGVGRPKRVANHSPHLVTLLRKSGVTNSLPPYTFVACIGKTLPFTTTSHSIYFISFHFTSLILLYRRNIITNYLKYPRYDGTSKTLAISINQEI